MLPILVKIGPISVPSWGTVLLIGFLLALWRLLRNAGRYGFDREAIWDASVMGLLGGVLGGRLAYVAQKGSYYAAHPGEIFALWQGGMTSFGGLIGGVIVGLIVAKKRGLNLLDTGDLAAPSLAIGQMVGRLGCVLNGCCYGHTCNLPWAMPFLDEHGERLPRHPTQIYEAIGVALAYGVLVWVERRRLFRGQVLLAFAALYAIVRFVVEIWREQSGPESVVVGLSTGQWASIVLLVIVAVLWPLALRRGRLNGA